MPSAMNSTALQISFYKFLERPVTTQAELEKDVRAWEEETYPQASVRAVLNAFEPFRAQGELDGHLTQLGKELIDRGTRSKSKNQSTKSGGAASQKELTPWEAVSLQLDYAVEYFEKKDDKARVALGLKYRIIRLVFKALLHIDEQNSKDECEERFRRRWGKINARTLSQDQIGRMLLDSFVRVENGTFGSEAYGDECQDLATISKTATHHRSLHDVGSERFRHSRYGEWEVKSIPRSHFPTNMLDIGMKESSMKRSTCGVGGEIVSLEFKHLTVSRIPYSSAGRSITFKKVVHKGDFICLTLHKPSLEWGYDIPKTSPSGGSAPAPTSAGSSSQYY